MDLYEIIIAVLVAAAVLIGSYYGVQAVGSASSSVNISGTIQDGKKVFNSKKQLPVSKNQREGLTFSYTCWVKIDDFSYRLGQQRVIFNKGSDDLSTACPALLLDAHTNSFIVKIDTYGATEQIPIANIPAKKWIHVGIAVDQDSADIYINGTLHTHHSLVQIPRQNGDTVRTGALGGFEGKVASLTYYSYFLTPDLVASSMAVAPQPDPNEGIGPLPPYFDIKWWTNSS
jgi:hypothetical protein